MGRVWPSSCTAMNVEATNESCRVKRWCQDFHTCTMQRTTVVLCLPLAASVTKAVACGDLKAASHVRSFMAPPRCHGCDCTVAAVQPKKIHIM